ncbi:four helix bundle protein [Candidatus Saccharibacteria bacterium]|jgi:four helix bundle protein|nr:four helix bundle protein [Candidatus Saccharibacteria bacterium]
MATYSFRDLTVWQRAMKLTEDIYISIQALPKTELYALSDQMKRCAVSVPSNIAEGQKRLNRKETIQFSGIALGSLAELQTQLIRCQKIYSLDVDHLVDECDQIGKMLTALIKALRSKL